MIAVDDVLTRAGHLLLDEEHVRWTVDELLAWLHDAAKAIITLDHKAGAVVEEVELAEGALQQVEALELMNVVRLLPSGRPIQRCDRYLLDSADPDWYAMTPTAKVVHFSVDDRDKATFYVYPPAAAGTKVEALLAKLPAAPTQGGELAIGAEYMDPLVNYVCYRALAKDSEYANGATAAAFYQAFQASVGGPMQSSAAVSPNNQGQMPGGEP